MTLAPRRIYYAALIAVAFSCASVRTASADELVIIGADSMVSAVTALADGFVSRNRGHQINVLGGGCAKGVDALLKGDAQAAMLDRAMTEDERHRVRRQFGSEAVGIPIAMDAVVLLVRPDNPLRSLAMEDLAAVATGRVRQWSQLTGDSVAHQDSHRLIRLYRPAEASGPSATIRHFLLGGKRFVDTPHVFASNRDLVHAVGADIAAFGIGSFSYTESTRVVGITPSKDAETVYPNDLTIRNRTYPFAHYVYLFFPSLPADVLRGFKAFAISAEGQKCITGAGGVPLPVGQ